MQQKNEQINLSDVEKSSLPLGYKKILIQKVPPAEVESKMMTYNKKYKQLIYRATQSNKPISKILK